MPKSLTVITLLVGMLMGCSDPMYPQPKLPPIVIPPFVPPPPIDRSLLTIVLPTSMSKDKDRPPMGRLRTRSPFNVQWISLPEHRQRDGKLDDAHFTGIAYYVTVFVPLPNGRERIALTAAQQPERDVESEGRWLYRLALTAPAEPGSYVVRLHTPDETISESILEVFAGEANGR